MKDWLLTLAALVACVLVLLSGGCQGCQPQPVPVVPPVNIPDASPRVVPDAYEDACSALSLAGCSEGKDPGCATVMRHADQSGITRVPVACLSNVKTAADAKACGFVRCE